MNEVFKIVRIVNDRNIVINAGNDQGLKEGDILEVFVPGEEIIDIDTGELLGTLDIIKAKLEIKNLYEKMPPQNETALVLFKLGLQNIRKLFHIANGIVLFPERAVVSQYRLFSPHKRDSDYGCPCGC